MRAASCLVVLLVFVPRAHACSCMQTTASAAFAEHDAVFEGRVVSVERDDARMQVRATLEVVQHWKGVDTERVVVITASNSAACGVDFAPETSWLVYAEREGELLRTGLCSRTSRIEDASADVAELGAGVVPVDVGADDEVEPPARDQAPARGGCASCSASPGARAPWLAAVAIVSATLSRRRWPSRRAAA